MKTICQAFLLCACCAVLTLPASAADNQLTAEEAAAGWKLLFNGKDHTGWKCNNGKEIATPIEEDSLLPFKSGGYLIVYDQPFKDFVLKCDVKMSKPYCNSGIFFRVSDLDQPVQRGMEVQIATSKRAGLSTYGAIYDLAKATTNPVNDDPWGWHTVTITCKGPQIEVKVDDEPVSSMNCDDFTEPNRRPDGSKHKFNIAIKELPHTGYVGLQDHGAKCWYKNVKILELE